MSEPGERPFLRRCMHCTTPDFRERFASPQEADDAGTGQRLWRCRRCGSANFMVTHWSGTPLKWYLRRVGQGLLVAAVLAALLIGSTWLTLVWLGIGVAGAPAQARLWALTRVWTPVSIVVWIAGAAALGSSGRALFAGLYLMVLGPAALGITATILNNLVDAPGLAVVAPLGLLDLAACSASWLMFTVRGRDHLPLWMDQ